jgi:magnesium transporter
MITAYARTSSGLIARASDPRAALVETGLIWVDLMSPDASEEAVVEAALSVEAPTTSERAALEESNRFYVDGSSLVIMVPVLGHTPGAIGLSRHAIAFVLDRGRLLTVRDCEHPVFAAGAGGRGAGQVSAGLAQAANASDVMLGVLEGLTERAADMIGEATEQVERLSESTLGGRKAVRLERTLRQLGQHGAKAARCRDMMAGLTRAARFCLTKASLFNLDRERLQALIDDGLGLQRQAEALMADLTFLLDATLGLVGARQNETLKIMAVVTLLFIPPTLIASFFGMNFEQMPWIQQQWGVWAAGGLMALSSVLVIAIGRIGRWI